MTIALGGGTLALVLLRQNIFLLVTWGVILLLHLLHLGYLYLRILDL